MPTNDLPPAHLATRLTIYFVVLFGATVLTVTSWPEVLRYLPLGGHHALESSFSVDDLTEPSNSTIEAEGGFEVISTLQKEARDVTSAVWFLSLHLSGTILLMIPISWVYMATRSDVGYQKNFARALIILPICATTIVMLIQDSLALAFGLAALVAAVRFRVSLDEAIDGVFVFAAICVGLAAGIGYLGIAAVMTVFFCFSVLILWRIAYGENPLDQARQEKKLAKLKQDQRESG